MNSIEVPLSKTKILLGILGSACFVLLGIYFCRVITIHFVNYVGVVGIIFFGMTGIYGLIKLFDKKIGLKIDGNGIFDNSNASSVGLIRWEDISSIQVEEINSTKFVLIYTKNPKYYLDRAGWLQKRLLLANNEMYGTPFSLTFSTLKTNLHELEERIKAYSHEKAVWHAEASYLR